MTTRGDALRALSGETQQVPPIWMMRQAGRHLPEYRDVRAKAGDFLSLCYDSDLATEVALQPIRRYDLDAAILFADILLVPHALGCDLRFIASEGPRLSPVATRRDVERLAAPDGIHDTLAPIYRTVRNLAEALPAHVALIGFAGAPWTVATYMIAGRGVPGQGPAHALRTEDPEVFEALMDLLTEATIQYLSAQIEAGAQCVKIFDSWAGSLEGEAFERHAVEPARRIVSALARRHPGTPVIAFPRGAGARFAGFHERTGAHCVAVDESVSPEWAAAHVQPTGCVQGNLAPSHLAEGGEGLLRETRRIVEAFGGGPHIFNLGHGVTPDADPDNVLRMIDAVRQGRRSGEAAPRPRGEKALG